MPDRLRINAHKRPKIDDRNPGRLTLPTATQRFSDSVAGRRFLVELAYYRADASYLPVDKCAERCRTLSTLLTAALDTSSLPDSSRRRKLRSNAYSKVKPTTEQRVAEKVRTGAFQSEDDVVREGVELIDAREAFRQAVAAGRAELDRGEYVTRNESRRRMAELADRYRRRG